MELNQGPTEMISSNVYVYTGKFYPALSLGPIEIILTQRAGCLAL